MARIPSLTFGALEGVMALHPRYMARAATMIQSAVSTARTLSAAAELDMDGQLYSWDRNDRGYDLVGAGLAIIPIEGVLVDQLGWLRPLYGWVTGYDGIRASLANALDDPAVERIALRIDSPGGMVSGCFDLADEISDAGLLKPIAAVLAENAYSAAYALACATSFISVPRTGGVGSIGVINTRVDISKMLDDAGVKVTFIVSDGADRKADGHPETPLSEAELTATQAEINYLGGLFWDLVARERAMNPEAVKALKAGAFLGPAGVEAGLADRVAAPTEALRAFAGL